MTTSNSGRLRCSLALTALLAGCGGGAPVDGGRTVVRIGWTGSPDSLNPGLGVLNPSYVVYGLVYDALVELDLDGRFRPSLAESWSSSDDGLEWTFRLRQGATFHDGAAVTAEDVLFSYDLYRKQADFPFLHAYTEAFAEIAAPDPSTFTLRLSHPVANLESQLVYLFVLPAHQWREVGDPAAYDNAAMTGSGPFRLIAHRAGESVRLAAHRQHPTAPPQVDEVVFVTYGTLDALVQALRTGELDVILGVPFTAVEALRHAPDIEVATGSPVPPNATMIELNQADSAACPAGGVCNGHPALRELAVRRALAMATPKRELIDVVILGQATPGKTLIPEGLSGFYHRELADYPHDPEAARALLDEAGYRDRDGDGVREMPDGSRDLELRLFFPSDSADAPRAADLLARAWSKIGVRLDRRALDATALAAVRGPAFDYDVVFWTWTSDPDPNFMLQSMTSEMIAVGGNYTGWSDPEFDELYRRQAATLDVAERQRLVWRMQEIALRDVVYVIPYYERSVQAYRRDRFRGWRTDAAALMFEDRSSLTRIVPVESR